MRSIMRMMTLRLGDMPGAATGAGADGPPAVAMAGAGRCIPTGGVQGACSTTGAVVAGAGGRVSSRLRGAPSGCVNSTSPACIIR